MTMIQTRAPIWFTICQALSEHHTHSVLRGNVLRSFRLTAQKLWQQRLSDALGLPRQAGMKDAWSLWAGVRLGIWDDRAVREALLRTLGPVDQESIVLPLNLGEGGSHYGIVR